MFALSLRIKERVGLLPNPVVPSAIRTCRIFPQRQKLFWLARFCPACTFVRPVRCCKACFRPSKGDPPEFSPQCMLSRRIIYPFIRRRRETPVKAHQVAVWVVGTALLSAGKRRRKCCNTIARAHVREGPERRPERTHRWQPFDGARHSQASGRQRYGAGKQAKLAVTHAVMELNAEDCGGIRAGSCTRKYARRRQCASGPRTGAVATTCACWHCTTEGETTWWFGLMAGTCTPGRDHLRWTALRSAREGHRGNGDPTGRWISQLRDDKKKRGGHGLNGARISGGASLLSLRPRARPSRAVADTKHRSPDWIWQPPTPSGQNYTTRHSVTFHH